MTPEEIKKGRPKRENLKLNINRMKKDDCDLKDFAKTVNFSKWAKEVLLREIRKDVDEAENAKIEVPLDFKINPSHYFQNKKGEYFYFKYINGVLHTIDESNIPVKSSILPSRIKPLP